MHTQCHTPLHKPELVAAGAHVGHECHTCIYTPFSKCACMHLPKFVYEFKCMRPSDKNRETDASVHISTLHTQHTLARHIHSAQHHVGLTSDPKSTPTSTKIVAAAGYTSSNANTTSSLACFCAARCSGSLPCCARGGDT